MAAALILTSLGVRIEDVLADFALTDQVVDLERALFDNPTGSVGFGNDQSYLRTLSPEVRAPLLKAAPEYLESAFEQLRKDHGSIEGYLRERLQVTDDAITRIRAHLLEEITSEAHT
jgi:protein-tyrosine phosphatase